MNEETTSWYPHVTVASVIEREGRFLLVEEHTPLGRVFNQPAGHLEAGEDLLEAARRETLEETGFDVVLDGILTLALYTSPANGVTYHRTTFFGHALGERSGAELDPDIAAVHWLSLSDMQASSDRMRSPLVIASVEHYLAGKRWPLDLIYRIK
jgi:8-oxo-dGTP pyrophosphatase MutT (NUDIX family)